MRRLLAVLVLVGATAHADPKCKPSGAIIFQLDQRADKKAKLATSKSRLYKNGAYITQTFDRRGTLATTTTGCLQPDRLAHFVEILAATEWKAEAADTCHETSPRFTEIRARSKLVFVDRRCSGKLLDHDSNLTVADFLFIARVPTMDDVRLPSRLLRYSTPGEYCVENPLASGCAD